MKKIALLMSLLLVFGIFAACEKTDTDPDQSGSDDTSSTISSEPDDTITYATVVSVGKSYTSSVEAGSSYEDSYGKELTDGIFADGDSVSYSDARLSGYNSSLNVVIDLGNDGKRLYRFEISYLSTRDAGIAPLSSGSVSISDDGKSWTRLGTVTKPEYIQGITQSAVFELDKPVDARYVRFDIYKDSAWVFLDELTVIADVVGTNAAMEYITLINEAYDKDNLTYEQRAAALSSVLGDSVDRTKPRVLVSKGSKYNSSVMASSTSHINDGLKLTDGKPTGAAFENDVWVGFTGGKSVNVTVTLDVEREDLAEFALSMFNRPSTGIMLPVYVDVSVSSDNNNYKLIGRVYATSDINQSNYTYYLNLSKAVKGKYVRFTLAETESQWFLIEEAAVYAYTNDELPDNDIFYPKVELPEVSSKTYWPSSSSNYKKNANLVLGLPYQISSGVKLYTSEASKTNDLLSSPLLTDGKRSTNTYYHNGMWFKTHRGASRSIYFDLTNSSTVTGYKVNFLKYSSVAVNLPATLTLHLSDDGVNWYLVSSATVEDVDGDIGVAEVSVTLSKAVQARFARISFDVRVHVYLDEIEIFGTKFVDPSTLTPDKLGVREEVTGSMLAPSEDILGGVTDVMLAYHNSPTSKLTQDVFLAYVAYLDSDNKIKDTMFDGYLFLPSTAALPSGGRPYAESVKSDWDFVLNSVFTEGINMDALNKAVEEAKTALNLPDYKVKVYYTILYPSSSITNFGDVDGDGISENFSILEDKLKAVGWYMDEFLSRFEQGNYQNLEFCGFYWFHETINREDGEMEKLQSVSRIVHERDTQFFWIPYFSANGYYQWSAYGFDAVCLQPNYAFNDDATSERIKDVAELIKLFNMCIEIEINSAALSDSIYFERYMDYLKGGVYYGYMTESIHMYYQGVKDFYTASQSSNLKTRLIYDYTYQFIKGTLNIYPDKLPDTTISVQKDTYYEGKLFEPDAILTAKVSVSAQNGTVTVNTDGSFRYYPNKGFTGTDTFTFKVSEFLDWSADTVVNVNVG